MGRELQVSLGVPEHMAAACGPVLSGPWRLQSHRAQQSPWVGDPVGGGGAGIPVLACPEFRLLVHESQPVSTAGQGQTSRGKGGYRDGTVHGEGPTVHPGGLLTIRASQDTGPLFPRR